MLEAMTDLEALEILRADIRKLFPPGPVREGWLAWSAHVSAVGDKCKAQGRAHHGNDDG
jgi:hypothetical protein